MAHGEIGTIYLLHFSEPLHHARHYLGWTSKGLERFDAHFAGRGSKLVRAAIEEGIGFDVALLRQGTRDDERRLHNRKDTPQWCPICKTARAGKRPPQLVIIADESEAAA